MSAENKEQARSNRAFQRGQSDFRDGKSTNPYPTVSPDHDNWEVGFRDRTRSKRQVMGLPTRAPDLTSTPQQAI